MNCDHQPLDQYLKAIVPPECPPTEHRTRLRGVILDRVSRRQSACRGRRWKTVALTLGLLGAGAVATELALQMHRYYFQGRASDGSYHFSTEPQIVYQQTRKDASGVTHTVSVAQGGQTRISASEDLDEAGIEQVRQDLDQIAALREKNARELVEVVDTAVNGILLPRTCIFKYELANGRTETMAEGAVNRSAAQIEQDQQQIDDLRFRGQREITGVIDTELDGQISRTLFCSYTLADGREISIGESDPATAQPKKRLTSEQLRELSRLMALKQGTFLDRIETALYGKTFAFERFSFQLADGTIVIRSEGKPKSVAKTELTETDWQELHQLSKTGAGEPLDEYTEEVNGTTFRFKPARYVLSDNTEVIQSRARLATHP